MFTKPLIELNQEAVKLAVSKRKTEDWLESNIKLINKFNFSDVVKDWLFKYLAYLAEIKCLHSNRTMYEQLKLLLTISELDQVKAIEDTILKGWKNISYSINYFKNNTKKPIDINNYSMIESTQIDAEEKEAILNSNEEWF